MIVDNVQKFRGYLKNGTNFGSLWIGATLLPLKKFRDNFTILSTDYDSFAIVTTCTPKTVMYDTDEITILIRQQPQYAEEEIEQKVRQEFKKLFDQSLRTEETEMP
jgi:replication fork clamp-binding protein CrfC